jgi:hypothetical protein
LLVVRICQAITLPLSTEYQEDFGRVELFLGQLPTGYGTVEA